MRITLCRASSSAAVRLPWGEAFVAVFGHGVPVGRVSYSSAKGRAVTFAPRGNSFPVIMHFDCKIASRKWGIKGGIWDQLLGRPGVKD